MADSAKRLSLNVSLFKKWRGFWPGLLSSPWLLLLLMSLFAIGPLLQPDYFWTAHDARHHVYFVFEFDRSVQDGIWYPRWSPDFAFGYGYPFFNIYGPLATAVGEVFHLLGFDFVTSVKLVFGLATLLSGLTMYGFVRRLIGPWAGFLAGLVYVYLPYHLFDLYVRAALAETVALVFLPLILWGFWEVVERPRLSAVVAAAFAYAGLVFSSNLILVLFSGLLGAYLIFLVAIRVNRSQPWREWSHESVFPLLGNLMRTALPAVLALILALGLSAIFWLPWVAEFQYVRTDQWYAGRYDYRDDFVYPFQLFSPAWGFGTSGPGPDDKVSFQLGAMPVVLGLLALSVAWRTRTQWRGQVFFFAGVALVTIWLMLPPAAALWEAIPPIRTAQFPWRYLTLATLALSVVTGAVLGSPSSDQESSNGKREHEEGEAVTVVRQHPATSPQFVALALAALVLLSSYPYLRAEVGPPPEGPVSLAGLMRFQHQSDEMTGSTRWVKKIPTWSPLADQILSGIPITTKVNYAAIPKGGVLGVHSLEMSTVHEKVWVYAAGPQRVIFYTAYYPGWTAYLYEDDRTRQDRTGRLIGELPIEPTSPQGWISVLVPAGEHVLEVRFEDTPVRIVSKWVSIGSLMVVLGCVVFGWRRRRMVK